jgi:phosphoesterase RecJ-like protein
MTGYEEMMTEIGEVVASADAILVTTHLDPDGDALGSLAAFGQMLYKLGKRPTLAVEGGGLRRFNYLPLARDIRAGLTSADSFDLMIALDCGDLDRVGTIWREMRPPHPPILNIDHHITNTRFGRWNLVAPACSSTAELLHHLFVHLEWPISDTIANSLLTGIVTDTLSFRTSNTTPTTLTAVADLMRRGADLYGVTQLALTRQPLATLWLLQSGLSGLRCEEEVIWTVISREALARSEMESSGATGLVTMLSNVEEARIAAVLTEEQDGRVKVSLRSRSPYDVAMVATRLGGGGHPQAAGCTLPGPLAAAEALLIPLLKAAITQQRPQR